MMEVEYVEKPIEDDNKKYMKYIKPIIIIYNWTCFILCCFSGYLILTIEWSLIKIIMLFVLANFITSFIFLVWFKFKSDLKERLK